jgi:hypothetical protein
MPAVLVKNVHVSLIRNSRFVGKNSLAAAGERLVFFFITSVGFPLRSPRNVPIQWVLL